MTDLIPYREWQSEVLSKFGVEGMGEPTGVSCPLSDCEGELFLQRFPGPKMSMGFPTERRVRCGACGWSGDLFHR